MSSSRRPYLYGRSRQNLLAGCHTLPRSPWHCQGDSSSSIRISMTLFSIPSLAQVRRQWLLSRQVVVTSVTTSTRDTSARLVSGSWLPILTPHHWTDGSLASLASALKTALCQYGHEGDTRLQMRHLRSPTDDEDHRVHGETDEPDETLWHCGDPRGGSGGRQRGWDGSPRSSGGHPSVLHPVERRRDTSRDSSRRFGPVRSAEHVRVREDPGYRLLRARSDTTGLRPGAVVQSRH